MVYCYIHVDLLVDLDLARSTVALHAFFCSSRRDRVGAHSLCRLTAARFEQPLFSNSRRRWPLACWHGMGRALLRSTGSRHRQATHPSEPMAQVRLATKPFHSPHSTYFIQPADRSHSTGLHVGILRSTYIHEGCHFTHVYPVSPFSFCRVL